MINKRTHSNAVTVALAAGSLWGVCEATLGYILHSAHVSGLAGTVMVPLGIYFMVLALKRSKKGSAIMMTAMVAAAWKGLNGLMPGGMVNILNPVQAILVEGLLVSVVFLAVDNLTPWARNSL